MTTPALTTDARNRALRTFLQGLASDVLAAVILLVLPVFTNAQGWQDVDWKILGFLLAKTVVVTALSYVMRTWLDKRPDALLPPVNPGAPADPACPHPPPLSGTSHPKEHRHVQEARPEAQAAADPAEPAALRRPPLDQGGLTNGRTNPG